MLQVFGGVQVRVDGQRAHLQGDGTQLFLDVEQPREFLRLLSEGAEGGGSGGGGFTLEPLRKMAAAFHAQGLTLHVSMRNERLATVGRDARPGLRERLLGLQHVALGSNDALIRLMLT